MNTTPPGNEKTSPLVRDEGKPRGTTLICVPLKKHASVGMGVSADTLAL